MPVYARIMNDAVLSKAVTESGSDPTSLVNAFRKLSAVVDDADAIVWKVIKSSRNKEELVELLSQSFQETIEENKMMAEVAIALTVKSLEGCDLLASEIVEWEESVSAEELQDSGEDIAEVVEDVPEAPEVEKIDDNTIVVEPEPVEEAPQPEAKKSLIDKLLGK